MTYVRRSGESVGSGRATWTTSSAWILEEHRDLTRRYFLRLGAAGWRVWRPSRSGREKPTAIECWRGHRPAGIPDSRSHIRRRRTRQSSAIRMTPEQRREIGLDRETWQLEVIADRRVRPDPKPALQGTRHRTELVRFDGIGRDTRRPLHEGDDLLERRRSVWHGPVGRCTRPRSDSENSPRGEPSPRLVLRLS